MLRDGFDFGDFLCAIGQHQLRPSLRLGAHRWTLENCCLACTRCPAEYPVGSRPLEGWCSRGGHIMWSTCGAFRRERRGCWWCGFTEEKRNGLWVAISGERHYTDGWGIALPL